MMYRLFRNEHGVGIRKERCGCETVYSPRGEKRLWRCTGHGGGWGDPEAHYVDIAALPTFEQAAAAGDRDEPEQIRYRYHTGPAYPAREKFT